MDLGKGTRITVVGAVLAALLVAAPGWTAPGRAGAEAAPAAAYTLPQQEYPETILALLRKAFGIYEEVRGEMVADRLERLPAIGLRLSGALRRAAIDPDGLTGRAPAVVAAAAAAADSLGEAEDLAAARVAFGEVSRGLMVLAGSDPRLTEGWHSFACPMVESFPKWIQPTAEHENPYMGPAMPKCGFASDWSVPGLPAVETAVASTTPVGSPTSEAARDEPEFKPGIPGLKMVDVRDHKFLWREIDELQVWEDGDRITVREFRSKAIEKTAHFLELESDAADEFVEVAFEAVDQVRESFSQRQWSSETSIGNDTVASGLQAAETRLTSLLEDKPRHQLFAPGCKKWLLRLAFGPKQAKEAREAKESGHAR